MKEIKQKPAGGKPKTADAARVPKAVVKAAWLQAREAARAGEKQVVGGKDGAYSGAADTGEKGADKLVSTGERVTELAYRGGRKLAERSAGQRRERAKAAQTGGEAAQRHGAGETIAHTSTIEASRPPQTREAGRVSDENRPAGARPQQRESRAVGRAKPIKPGREMKQGAPGPKTTEQAGKARQAVQAAARNGQAKARFTQRAQQTAKRAVDTTKRATDAARAGMRALVEALHSLLIALAAGGSVAVLIVVLICLIAFVAGSAYGIFFAAEAPGEDAFTVQQAVEQLGGEYRDYLQQIESTMPHDRQEIKANDDVYYIRWQDVLAVFSSYVSGAEDGAPVAYLDESRLQQLRQTMWDMNEVAYSTYTETVEIEADEPAGDENTDSGDSSKNPGEDTESGNGTESAAAKTVTQTVLLIELTHKTPDEMAQGLIVMKIVVCDDDALVYEQMKNIIASYSIVKNENLELTFYQTVEELLHAKHKYDILFLDIRFNNCDIGIDVAKKLRKAGNTSLIILLTSLHSKAIEGYEIGAYRYIVKPIIKEKMYAVLDEAISSIHSNYRVILVKDMYNTVVVKIQQILYIYSNARKRCLVTLDGEIETWEQLKSIYAKLPQEQFAYAQKGFVVNYKMIKKLNKTGVELVNGENVPISRGMKNEFFANYFEFLGK